ncbi:MULTISPECIES: hypothetical protein [unclassified Pseudomonas]|jgi:hypothetical protein|uniref:hypothetical protein n=1 Tax=unclassified Pseudomonas TaxID=196821 RepID=UPI000876B28C|nr:MULTISPECIES: hypothetical protein [unclassified Pseudomonas]SCX52310.1 hypothetical protein SAMN03159507_01412 [Pseudomonas sp. NFACC32-1]SFW54462.1 hypothetical protein SAMN03159376_02101 [Pseudomonas sp. NFACC09-4]SFX18303.1 hypothetical protein SAMN03159390_00662 [Pseudomonas sp. NFACC49-2]SFX25489.1 hypothetical protein SAMN03159442_00976 [Pseudomonas sp. NFACC47-1]SFX46521.1 hypothetical protein SAMN03159309_01619 [Pseudomonas sp. NFACC36]
MTHPDYRVMHFCASSRERGEMIAAGVPDPEDSGDRFACLALAQGARKKPSQIVFP